MVVGPAAIGKSTLMNEVVAHDPRFKRVRSFTTRPPRSNDEPGHYFYFTEAERAERSRKGECITDVIYPTTGYHYGTVAESFESEFNLLDTLSGSVETYRNLPFKHTVVVSMCAAPDDWEAWLDLRYPTPGEERTKRLQEALLSTEWSLAQTSDHAWIINSPTRVAATATTLVRLASSRPADAVAPPEALELQKRIRFLLSYG